MNHDYNTTWDNKMVTLCGIRPPIDLNRLAGARQVGRELWHCARQEGILLDNISEKIDTPEAAEAFSCRPRPI